MKTQIKTILAAFFLTATSSVGFSQQWSGSTTNNGIINRTGGVILGNTTARQGSYSSNWKYIELQDEGIISIGKANNDRLQMVHSSFGSTLTSSDRLTLSGKNALRFQTNGDFRNNKMMILPNGNVGIGTDTPTALLDVNGGATFANDVEVNGSLKVSSISNSTNFLEADENSFKLKFGSGLGATTVLDATLADIKLNRPVIANGATFSENVGIGTTNTEGEWKLAVNGKIRAKEIRVETNWSDFVFYDSYKLPTLKEVEEHIKEKGHLKDIPSAETVEKEGVSLGEMDSKLLQKIEELTLYTIQQDKQLKRQSQEISELKILVKALLEK